MPDDNVEPIVDQVLRELKASRCVLLSGPPSTGKTLIINRVLAAFRGPQAGPVSDPSAPVPIPATGAVPTEALPSPERSDRQIWQTTMDQTSSFREYWRAVELEPGAQNQKTRVSKGLLYQANEHALNSDGTALIAIDEFNRGPAVAVLGRSVGAIEGDKRLAEDGNPTGKTVGFPLPNDDGEFEPYQLSAHLYLLAAQNNADTSVSAIDVAFLRRFSSVQIWPNVDVLKDSFSLPDLAAEPPESPGAAADVYLAAVLAWQRVNARLSLGRGPEFQIGHGVLMEGQPPTGTAAEALDFVQRGWRRVETHVEEVFFNNVESQAACLLVNEATGHPYSVQQESFGALDVAVLNRPALDRDGLYRLLRSIATAP